MEIYTSDNEKVKILTQDSGMLYFYSTKPGDLLGEGERLDSLTLTPDEMISLGRTLTTRGEALKEDKKHSVVVERIRPVEAPRPFGTVVAQQASDGSDNWGVLDPDGAGKSTGRWVASYLREHEAQWLADKINS
jgi:hypothetical protein